MVVCSYTSDLGENLFQYCYARSLAEALNLKLQAHGIQGFPKSYDQVTGRAFAWPFREVTADNILPVFEEGYVLRESLVLAGSWRSLELAQTLGRQWSDWLLTPRPEKKEAQLGICWGVGDDPEGCVQELDTDDVYHLLENHSSHEIVVASPSPAALKLINDKQLRVRVLPSSSASTMAQLLECEQLIIGVSAFDQMAAALSMSSVIYYKNPAAGCCPYSIQIPCPKIPQHREAADTKRWVDLSEV